MSVVHSNELGASGPPADVLEVLDTWNYPELVSAMFCGFILQGLLLPTFDSSSAARCAYAEWFDLLVIARVLWAYFLYETGKGWIFYCVLMLTSAMWIPGITDLFSPTGYHFGLTEQWILEIHL